MTVTDLSAGDLRRAYAARDLSPVEVVARLAERREALAETLNTWVTCDAERALDAAGAAERRYAAGAPQGPLDGVPLAVKDIFDTADVPTAYGSSIFRGHRPVADAPVVAAARAAGAVVLGKTGTHEFAWGITTENPHFGPVHNPWDPRRVPGGSSGGSAAAVAAGEAPLAFGSDTAGSARIPAAYCGVVGFKVSYGLVPLGGVWPLAPSLDHLGFFARRPEDVADLLRAVLPGGGRRVLPGDGEARLDARAGVLEVPDAPPLEAGIRRALDDAASVLAALGADVEPVAFEGPSDALHRVQGVEAFRVHHGARLFPARASEYGADVRARLEAGEALTLADYLSGLEAMRRIRDRVDALFDRVDLLLSPVSACAPPPIGQTAGLRDLVLPYTVPQSLAGLPACVVRAGFDDLGLPVGAQLTGPRFADLDVLRAAAAFMDATAELQARRPPL